MSTVVVLSRNKSTYSFLTYSGQRGTKMDTKDEEEWINIREPEEVSSSIDDEISTRPFNMSGPNRLQI